MWSIHWVHIVSVTEPQLYTLFSTQSLVIKFTICELKSYIDEKSSFSAFQQGVCQISISVRFRDMAKKAKLLDKMTYRISELMTSDGWTYRQTDGCISNSIDPCMLYACGTIMKLTWDMWQEDSLTALSGIVQIPYHKGVFIISCQGVGWKLSLRHLKNLSTPPLLGALKNLNYFR